MLAAFDYSVGKVASLGEECCLVAARNAFACKEKIDSGKNTLNCGLRYP